MIQKLDSLLSDVLFGLVAVVGLVAPWMFGAWETRWFWPFMTCLFAAGICFGGRMVVSAELGARRLNISTLAYTVISAWVPFLIYAVIRSVQSEVRMDAERSLLLQTSPVLLAVMVAFGLTESRQRIFLALVMVNFAGLGLYGISNHYLTGNARVLWVPGFAQYQCDPNCLRATGSYYCPDHFSGIMEIALAMALSLLLLRTSTRLQRLASGLLAGISIWAIVLTRSRGGGIVTGMLLIASLWLCARSWPGTLQRIMRWGGLTVVIGGILIFVLADGHYMTRFKTYPWAQMDHSERVQMSSAALRAWLTAPWLGVGPGMHPNLWPHFAPTSDGDLRTGKWPSHLNNQYHSYEAHNDWAQFLEEYGIVGVALFFLAAGTLTIGLLRRWRQWTRLSAMDTQAPPPEWVIPGFLLAGMAMAVHSLGDFNLQMPATTWQLGILAGLALALARLAPPLKKSMRSDRTAHE